MTCVILLCSPAAWAYRPYDSTDADVADDDEIELEVGWRDSKIESDHEQAARAVLNFGIGRDREIVVEGEWQRSPGAKSESSIGDVGLFLKQVHRRGSLQGEPRMSVASECGALIPTRSEDSGLGGECALIASHSISMLSLHANASLAFETDHRWVNSIGLILEGPDSWRIRPGLELVREDAAGDDAEFSMLAGAIWNSADGLEFDVAYRRGLQPSGEPSEWRVGITWSR
ncbi:MAG TPA: hypothetical protein VFU13_22820 [Steroidobacteraceae bacterium]|nr:hypothetical protein [Steroidobacteraceae bacterium]